MQDSAHYDLHGHVVPKHPICALLGIDQVNMVAKAELHNFEFAEIVDKCVLCVAEHCLVEMFAGFGFLRTTLEYGFATRHSDMSRHRRC